MNKIFMLLSALALLTCGCAAPKPILTEPVYKTEKNYQYETIMETGAGQEMFETTQGMALPTFEPLVTMSTDVPGKTETIRPGQTWTATHYYTPDRLLLSSPDFAQGKWGVLVDGSGHAVADDALVVMTVTLSGIGRPVVGSGRRDLGDVGGKRLFTSTGYRNFSNGMRTTVVYGGMEDGKCLFTVSKCYGQKAKACQSEKLALHPGKGGMIGPVHVDIIEATPAGLKYRILKD